MRLSANVPSMKRLLSLLVVLAAGCGSAPPTPAAAPSSPSSDSTPEPTAEPPTAEPKAESGELHAEIADVRDAGESPPGKSVKMRFVNPTGRDCEVTTYELEWPGGKKLVSPERSSNFKRVNVPAGATRQRSLSMHANDGDLSTLDAQSAKVRVESSCP